MSKNRSPRYPAVGLPDCIRGVRVIHHMDTLTKIDQEAVAKHLGYEGLSGPALARISAIRKYGLMEGPGKALQVTKDALTIIADSVESPERQAAIQRSARRPALFAKLFDYFQGQKPSAENLQSYLTKQGFTTSGRRKAAKAFLDTIDLVSQEGGVYHADGEGEEEGAEQTPGAGQRTDDRQYGGAHVGDLIQWEAAGVLKLETPRRVRAVGEYNGQEWVFIEGEETGIPMTQVIVEEKAGDDPNRLPPTPPILPLADEPLTTGKRKEVTSLDEGDAILIWPEEISAESYDDFEAWLNGIMRKARRRAGVAEKVKKPPTETAQKRDEC